MKQHFFTILISILFSNAIIAQPPSEIPPNGELGKCYAMCIIPNEWTTIQKDILVKEASTRIEIIPAIFDTVYEKVIDKAATTEIKVTPIEFETVTERIMVKAPSTRIDVIPAEFETVTEKVLAKAGCSNRRIIPAVYETIIDTIEVKPVRTKWVRSKMNGASCICNTNPGDCEIWCLEEVPAQYEYVTRNILKTPATIKDLEEPAEYQVITKRKVKKAATTITHQIPAEYKVVTKRVVKTPHHTAVIEIPATFKTIQKIIVKMPAQTRIVDIPAEYDTINKRILVKKGGWSEWKEILCPTGRPRLNIEEIQVALKKTGYYRGKIDGVLGPKTKAGLIQFQKTNNLPTGRLDIDTLKALGIIEEYW